ncbi:insulinase family protein [Pedobacter panaciterrae]|uniref:Insulinase family protein n=1 Tax=Pedobacter panaciterrae TaxID=363849 RepID=A0ABU8NIL6_9SPHI
MIKLSLKTAATLLLVVVAGAAEAQQKYEWKQASDGKYQYRYVASDPLQSRFYTLKNGLTVILSVNKKEPRIQTLIGVRAGSNNDPKTNTGLAHYLEHLLFKGTDKYGSLDWTKEKPYIERIEAMYDTYTRTTDPNKRSQIYRQIDSVSGIAARYSIASEYDKLMQGIGSKGTNAYTSFEETVYTEDIPSASLDQYLAVQAERFRMPVFRLFHTELEAVYEEKNRSLDNDQDKASTAMLEALFPTYNYGQQTTLGTTAHLKNPNLKAIRNFYNTWYVPNNMAIVLAGDFDPSTVIEKVAAAFAYMQPKAVVPYKPAPEVPIKAPITREVVGPDAESISIAFRLPGSEEASSQILGSVVSSLLSNGVAGLIDIELNQQQRVQEAGAYYFGLKDYAVLNLNGLPKSGQSLDEVKALLLKQIDKIKAGEFDETLIAAIVNNSKLSAIKEIKDNEQRASRLMSSFIQTQGANWLDQVRRLEQMSKVSKAQVIAFAKQHFNNNYVAVYKRNGEDPTVVKVEKPVITPIFINTEASSPFLEKVLAIKTSENLPKWVDFNSDMKISKAGNADLYYVKNVDDSLFNFTYRYQMGRLNDGKLPIALEYLKFLGTEKMSSEDFVRQFYKIGCSYEIKVGDEETSITVSGLQENFDKAVSLFEELINNAKEDGTAYATFKERIENSRANNKLDKSVILRGMTQYAIYGAQNPFNFQLNQSELDQMTGSELVSLLHKLKTYDHQLLYYGPLDMTAAASSIQSIHPVQSSLAKAPAAKIFQKKDQQANEVFFTDYDMLQAEVYWVRNTDVYDAKNAPLVELFNGYFGGGMGSVVFQTLRESKALAYSTFANYESPVKTGQRYTQVAYIGSQSDKMTEAITGMNELLNNLPKNPALLLNTKKAVRQGIANERIQPDQIFERYFAARKLGLNEDPRKNVYDSVEQLGFNDLETFAAKYLKNKTYGYCILGAKTKVNPESLTKYGTVKELTLAEIFGY